MRARGEGEATLEGSEDGELDIFHQLSGEERWTQPKGTHFAEEWSGKCMQSIAGHRQTINIWTRISGGREMLGGERGGGE